MADNIDNLNSIDLNSINQEFDDFQFDLINRTKHFKFITEFSTEDKLDILLSSLSQKEIIF